MQLDIYSDVVCPWCYLGHTRLEEARERLAADGHEVELRWRAFQLDPAAGSEPRDLGTAIDRKYGPGAFEVMGERLGRLGTEAGIEYRFDRALRVGTRDAHRLIQWTQDQHPALTDATATRLFRAYFSEGANVADPATLAGLAAEVGLPADEATEVLVSDSYADRVSADQAAAGEIGVTGVPAVVFNGAVVIPGAQEVDTVEKVLRRLVDRAART